MITSAAERVSAGNAFSSTMGPSAPRLSRSRALRRGRPGRRTGSRGKRPARREPALLGGCAPGGGIGRPPGIDRGPGIDRRPLPGPAAVFRKLGHQTYLAVPGDRHQPVRPLLGGSDPQEGSRGKAPGRRQSAAGPIAAIATATMTAEASAKLSGRIGFSSFAQLPLGPQGPAQIIVSSADLCQISQCQVPFFLIPVDRVFPGDISSPHLADRRLNRRCP